MNSERQIFTVTELNKQARRLLESHFDYVWIEGELSNVARPGSGHWYLTLKDEGAQVRAAMFRNRNQLCRFQPESGQRVRVRARVSLYEGRGEFQLILEHMELAGDGALQAAFEQLKKKLAAEGLFDPDSKKSLPSTPGTVALITSGSGAALHDLLTVFSRRYPLTRLLVIPSRVQGAGADLELSEAISRAESAVKAGVDIDAVILARGGGSAEDLWTFNSEALARRIAACNIPTVSAVGHETDFTISDFVADQRAATPSAAAELLTPDRADLLRQLSRGEVRLLRKMADVLNQSRQGLDWLERRMRDPRQRLRDQGEQLRNLHRRLHRAGTQQVSDHRHRLLELDSELRQLSPAPRMHLLAQRLEQVGRRLARSTGLLLTAARQQLDRTAGLLDAVSPLATVKRGYSIVTDTNGDPLRDTATIVSGAAVQAHLARGTLHCTVDAVDQVSLLDAAFSADTQPQD